MKKVLAIILALVMVIGLCACGSKSGDTQKAEDNNTNSNENSQNTATEEENSITSTDVGEVTKKGDEADTSEGPVYGGDLRVVSTAEGATPIGVPWNVIGIDVNLCVPFGESLVTEASDGTIGPWLAESWEVNIDEPSVTFKLRQGVKFTDGTDFNADVCAWTINHFVEAGSISPSVLGAEKVDDYTVKVNLKTWANTIMATFASHSFSMISKEAYEANGEEWAQENPVGTGPFVLSEYIHGQYIKFVKNENYWQEGKPYLDSVTYVFMSDTMTQNSAMKVSGADGIDVLNTTNANQITTLMENDGLYMATNSIGPVSLIPSSNDPDDPLSKFEVRQAISLAIDREALMAARGFGIYTPAYQFVPEAWGCHLDSSHDLKFDVEQAKKLLTDAGYPNGFTTTFYVMPNMVDKDVMVAVQSMLSAIGITVELEFPDSGGYSNYRYGGWTNGFLVQHTRSLASIGSTFGLYFDVSQDEETGEYSWTYMPSAWRPAEELYAAEQAAGATPEMDNDLLKEVHAQVLDNLVCIPIYNLPDCFIMKNTVHDTGFAEWGAGTIWLPSEAWMSAN
ncbi:MAG: ABC transporter substrate-binding protein [Oscillospiraceae bacterium]|nr:ABC transporter substrate-binding protein [Oscillospiraceae bacterium]